MTSVDHGAVIRSVLAACKVTQLSIAHVSRYGERAAFRVTIAPLTVDPRYKCEQLSRRFKAAGMPTDAITYETDGVGGSEQLHIVVTLQEAVNERL